MDNLIDEFQELRLSALSKSQTLNPFVNDVTLGPHSTKCKQNHEEKLKQDVENHEKTKPVKNRNDQHIQLALFKSLARHLEDDRLEKVQEAVNDHKQRFINFSKQIQEQNNEQWSAKQKLLSTQMYEEETDIMRKLEEHSKEGKSQQEVQIEKYYQNEAEMRKQRDREQERLKCENERRTIIIEEIKKCEIECQQIYEKIIPLLGSCKKEVLEKHANYLNSIPIKLSKICNDCAKGIIDKEQLMSAQDILRNVKNIFEELKESSLKLKAESQISVPQVTVKVREVSANVVDKFISKGCLKNYERLQAILEHIQLEYSGLENDDSFKQFRFDCKKAINIPVNAISAASGKHLLDKYMKLSNLLSGKNVQIGDSIINASRHKDGIKYCTDMLAQKFVLQGDLMISSNPDSAFCYATIILTLWSDFPLFGDLLLARLYKLCPYLIPLYMVKGNNQSDEEYYKFLGYQYNSDGTIEKQDKYLKRLTGVMRLYSAMMVAKPKSCQCAKCPFGLANAWQWFCCMLNLPPKPDVTATLLHVFLQNVGAKMSTTYRNQFTKLMQFLNENYLLLLKKTDSGGPVTRLEGLLREYNAKNGFDLPSGILADNFW